MLMEIINEKNEAFHILKLVLFKSFVMFCSSVLCGWIIYNFFPNWIEDDFLLIIKTSVLGTILLGWLIFYPKFICSKIWGLSFISFLGGIFFSLFFIFYGVKYCLLGCCFILAEFIIGIFLGKIFQEKISAVCFFKSIVTIFICAFLYFIYLGLKYGTFVISQPFYYAFVLLAFAQLIFACSHAQEIAWNIINSSQKHPQNRYVILFYLNLLSLGFFIDVSRIIVLAYYYFIQILCFQKK